MPKKIIREFVKFKKKGGSLGKGNRIPKERIEVALKINSEWMQKARASGGNPANLGQALVLCRIEPQNALKIFVKYFANKEGDFGASNKANEAMQKQYFPFLKLIERKNSQKN